MNPVSGDIYPAALIGLIAPGTGDPANLMIVTSEVADHPKGLIDDMGPLTAPRLGFACDPFGSGTTSIRRGFGIFCSRPLGGSNTASRDPRVVQLAVRLEF